MIEYTKKAINYRKASNFNRYTKGVFSVIFAIHTIPLMKNFLLYAYLFLAVTFALAQGKEDLVKEFDDLRIQFCDTSVSFENAKTLASEYLVKAKKNGEKKFIGRGYYLLASKTKELKERVHHLDSAISNIKNIENEVDFLTMLYMYRGVTLDLKRDYYEALNNYLTADSIAEIHKSEKYLYATKFNIAFLKRVLGEYQTSEKLFMECLLRLEAKEEFNILPYIQTLFQLSSVYYESGAIAKCTAINLKGIQLSKNNDLLEFYYHFVVNEGINLNIKGDYQSSIDSIQKGYSHLQAADKEIANFYLGKSYYAISEKEKAFHYFKKIDTIFRNKNDLLPPLRESYVYLINESKRTKNKENQLYYTTQLLKVDSVIHADYKYLSSNIFKKYDTPKYEAERNLLIKDLEEENADITQRNKRIVILSVLFCLLMLGGFMYNYRLKKKYEKRYNDIIDKSKASIEEEIIVKNEKPQAISLGIDTRIAEEILQALAAFEKGEDYLKNQISLKDVAKIVNTNSKYLSKIVNFYKGKNFTTYINDLRIEYLVSHIQTETKYQKYTIRAIAEEIGFSNPEGFSRAFQKNTGLKPSYFIKKVRENSQKKQ